MSHKQDQTDENVYLENTQNTSNKFFHIQLKHKTITKQYGKINSSGQTQEKKYPLVEDAEKEFQHIIQSKLKKGYVRVYKQERNTKPIVHLPSKPKSLKIGRKGKKEIKTLNKTLKGSARTRKHSKTSSATSVSKMIQDVQNIFDQDVQEGPVFQSQDGWTPELIKTAKDSIPSYVDDYPDTAKDSPGNIVEMLWEDFEPSRFNTQRNK